jgi:hypothetical protein
MLASPKPAARRTLSASNLDRILNVYPTVDAALEQAVRRED